MICNCGTADNCIYTERIIGNCDLSCSNRKLDIDVTTRRNIDRICKCNSSACGSIDSHGIGSKSSRIVSNSCISDSKDGSTVLNSTSGNS